MSEWSEREKAELEKMYRQGWKRSEIADALGKSPGQIGGMINRMRIRRQEEMDPRVHELRGKLRKAYADKAKLQWNRVDMRKVLSEAVEEHIELLAGQLQPVPEPITVSGTGSPEIAVAMYSDLQLGKRTPDYNSEVGRERSARYADLVVKLTNIQRAHCPIDEVHVWLMGDIVEGELIFPGQEFLIDTGLYRQAIVNGPSILCQFLDVMLANFKKVHVSAVIGNHGAIAGRQRRNMHPESNADLFTYEIVRTIYRERGEDRISFDIPLTEGGEFGPWYTIDKIGGFKAMLFHGDQIQGSSTFPWYGFHKKVLGWNAIGNFPDFPMDSFNHAACGHWHVPAEFELNGIEVRVNGTFESYNTYAQMQLASMGMPKQRLLFVHPKHGWVTNEYKVKLWESARA